ncbi:hypothetical protein [Mesorhizobium sp.]|uniref:hypothetical protein n=1 Tax=Mesorhizobium sp. TaxID=1871066 RepID=UPI001218F7C7|nr:hypothetical protein [Mesorhizobium sp.]TIV59102.1 MAG: hypothetical protein E5V80_15500 [Mesorhizobium sp.]
MTIINDQWELVEDRLRGRGKVSYYEIGANRLTETGNSPYAGELYDWPIQIAQKVNFDYEQFVEAFRTALDHFAGKYKPSVDSAMLEASIETGREFDKAKHG